MLLVGLAFGALSTFVPLFIKSVGVDLNAGLFYTAAAIASFSVRSMVVHLIAMVVVCLSPSA